MFQSLFSLFLLSIQQQSVHNSEQAFVSGGILTGTCVRACCVRVCVLLLPHMDVVGRDVLFVDHNMVPDRSVGGSVCKRYFFQYINALAMNGE